MQAVKHCFSKITSLPGCRVIQIDLCSGCKMIVIISYIEIIGQSLVLMWLKIVGCYGVHKSVYGEHRNVIVKCGGEGLQKRNALSH